MRWICLLALLALVGSATPAVAGTIYKCVDAHGQVSWQDTPCKPGEKQTAQHVANARPAPPTSALATPAPRPVSPPPASRPAPKLARVPPPVVYRCTDATNGNTYLSRTGRTRPYLAPFAMLGAVQVPLAVEYGSMQGNSVGMSAPELMPDPTPAMIGSHYVWVQDRCRRLPPEAACAALEKLSETNARAIHNAFPKQRVPLRKKQARLRQRMAGCRY